MLMENQLVAYKLLFAEKSSKLMDTEDNYGVLYKKVENLNEKCKVKDEIIKNLISERDSIRNNYLTSSNNNNSSNKNEFFQSYQNSENFNRTNNYCLTQRPVSDNHSNMTSHYNSENLQKEKNVKKGPGIILDGNKSILSKNNETEKNLFDNKRLSTQVGMSTNENNVNVPRHNSCINNGDGLSTVSNISIGSGVSNVSNFSNVSNVNQQQKTMTRQKSNGLFGSIKNLFGGEKSKK